MGILMKTIESEAAEAIGYDEKKRVLRIRYAGGRVYDYFRVPPQEYFDLLQSPSAGNYINRVIKKKYENKEVI